MLDVNRLILLRELHMRGSMTAVARAMNFSPSAISQHIAQLEKEAGQPLIRHIGRGVQLTPQGLALADIATELVNVLERAEATLQHFHETARGTVRVAVFQSAALALMPAAMRELGTRFPEVRVEMVQKEPAEALHGTWSREFDLVIAEEYPAHSAPWLPGLHRETLAIDDITLAVPAESSIVALHQASHSAWVMEPPGTASRHFAEQLCRLSGFEPDVRFETADLQAHIRLVESGNAVALLPGLVWRGRTPLCRLVEIDTHPRRTVFMVMRETESSAPAVDAVRRVLKETAEATSPSSTEGPGNILP